MNHHISFVFIVLAIVSLVTGCGSGLRDVCDQATPVILEGHSYGIDATNAISQAEAYASQLPLPAEIKSQLQRDIDEARRAISVGEIALAAAAHICSAKDSVDAFKELIDAWGKIEAVLATNTMSASLNMQRRGLYVPAIVRLSRTRSH